LSSAITESYYHVQPIANAVSARPYAKLAYSTSGVALPHLKGQGGDPASRVTVGNYDRQ